MFADRKSFLVVELNLAAVHADDIIPFRVKFVIRGSPGLFGCRRRAALPFPYFLWGNREPGNELQVWFAEKPQM